MKLHLEKIIQDVKFLVLTNLGPAVSIGNSVYLNDKLIFENIDPVTVMYQCGLIWAYNQDSGGISIYSTETKQNIVQKIENFAGTYPFIVEETKDGSVDQYLYIMYDYVLRPIDFKIMKYNIGKRQAEGDQSFLNGSMIQHCYGEYFIDWPAGRHRTFGVIDTASQTNLWQEKVDIYRSLTWVAIHDSKIYVQESNDKSSALHIYDLYTGTVDTKRLFDGDFMLAWPLKHDASNDKLVMPFAEVDIATLKINSNISKYRDFIRSNDTRYGYSGLNCFNDLFYAMSCYRDNPIRKEEVIYELVFFERHTFNRIYLKEVKGFTNPIRDLQCTNHKLFLRDTSGTLFIYDIEPLEI